MSADRSGGRKQIGRFVAKRLLRALLIVFAIAVFNFLLLHCAPGDLVDVLAGESGAGDAEFAASLRAKYGLDQPLAIQLLAYLKTILSFDLGFSFRQNTSVLRLILERVPATLLLVLTSLALALAGGTLAGAIAARHHNKAADWVISSLALLLYATPLFWLGLMLIVVFTVKLDILPSSGMFTAGRDAGPLATAWDIVVHMVLPTMTLGFFYLATYTRLARASMLDVFQMDFVRTAVAKGLSRRRIVYRHVLRNSILPLVTMFGVQFGAALGGAVVVEVVFGWPGLGRLAFEAVFSRDFNLLLGILFLSSILVIVVNVATDIVYTLVDPRIALE
jgi:peptide/nickel transport system permease protein